MIFNKKDFLYNFFLFLFYIICLVSLWEIIVKFYNIDMQKLPSPSDIIKILTEKKLFWFQATKETAILAFLGFMLGFIAGCLCSIAIYMCPFLDKFLQPLFTITQNLPLPVLIPLLTLLFGFSFKTRLIVVILITFFPVMVATNRGLYNNPRPELKTYFNIMGASRWQKLIHLAGPSSLTSCLSGAQIAATYSIFGAVWGENAGSSHGLGIVLKEAFNTFRTDYLFTATLLIIFLSLLFSFLIRISASYILKKWRIVL